MVQSQPDTEELVRRAAAGDDSARDQLLTRHRSRLKGMVSIRMDRRLATRVDPSDVVQDALIQAARQLPDYLLEQSLPFYPWLRQFAIQQLIRQYRRHIKAGARSLKREEQHAVALPDQSAIELAARLLADHTSPSEKADREDLRKKIQAALDDLSESDREVLVLRFLEQLSTKETAAVLGLTVNGVKSRQSRALERFTRFFGEHSAEGNS